MGKIDEILKNMYVNGHVANSIFAKDIVSQAKIAIRDAVIESLGEECWKCKPVIIKLFEE